jgi:(1->4)-alpha-D-glucan 1-alpha-D-glucosylmutase
LSMTVPIATYRLQLRGLQTFDKAGHTAPYLARLGVSHLYISPIFAAAPGSTHGYDVIDFGTIEPAIGGKSGFVELCKTLEQHQLKIILDMVPNHMSASQSNPWWRNVLEWGSESAFAEHFDVDWTAQKLLLPLLDKPFSLALRGGELGLEYNAEQGQLSFTYHDTRLPVAPRSYAQVLSAVQLEPATVLASRFAAASSHAAAGLKAELATAGESLAEAIRAAVRRITAEPAKLDQLHNAQIWRLVHWRLAREMLTYRRFFEISELVGIAVERAQTFNDVHALLLDLIAHGTVEGVRVDHIDGLAEPRAYLARLKEVVGRDDIYVVVEKILGSDERLPAAWATAGTTGYEFISTIAGLFVDAAQESAMLRAYVGFTASEPDYSVIATTAKRRTLTYNLAGELDALVRLAVDLACDEPEARDYGRDTLRRAIVELAVAMGVYRTYIDGTGPSNEDRRHIAAAAQIAKATGKIEDETVIDNLSRLLLLNTASISTRAKALAFTLRFQQTTVPLMAKAIEDTAFYRYNRLIALNEVGGAPGRYGAPVSAFHEAMIQRAHCQPLGLTATATHDTKRGEDARVRLYVLSERPQDWRMAVEHWSKLNTPLRGIAGGLTVPEAETEWLFYQALLGAWPATLNVENAAGLAALSDRMASFMRKASREAKLRTSWTRPNLAYEQAIEDFVRAALLAKRSAAFLADFTARARPVCVAGALNGLSQTLLKLTVPGIPDIYQGTELWDLALVDPDNRRPVDFTERARLLADDKCALPHELLATWPSGAIKLRLLRAGLALRARLRNVFERGRYQPLNLSGERAQHAVAYARIQGEDTIIALAPRLALGMLEGQSVPLVPAERWAATRLLLPSELKRCVWRNVITGDALVSGDLEIATLLSRFPVALLVNERS